MGCGCCVKACGCQIIELVNTSTGIKAQIINALECLGDGHCKSVCPTGAIECN
ncbi:4Fe-4S dicluster domain-containing protein [Halanaerocella petrolearia]